ncbi:MAG: hypothetical protein WCI18_06090 [Pseudomonadota bacterium]
MKYACTLFVILASSCKQVMPRTQRLQDAPDAILGSTSQDRQNAPLETEILHTSIGSSDTLTPRIQGKWTIHCANPTWGLPFYYNRDISFSHSTYSEVVTAFTSQSDCQDKKDVSMKLLTTGRLTLVDGTKASAKVNFISESARYFFYKDDSIFVFFKNEISDLILNQEKTIEKQQTTFGLMGLEEGKLCFGNFSVEKNGLSEARRPESLDLTGCLTLMK